MTDSDGQTLLHAACQRCSLFLFTCNKSFWCSGNVDLVRFLIETQKLDLTVEDKYHITPFHNACESGHLSLVQYLCKLPLSQRPNVKRRNSCITLAFTNGHKSTVSFLQTVEKTDAEALAVEAPARTEAKTVAGPRSSTTAWGAEDGKRTPSASPTAAGSSTVTSFGGKSSSNCSIV